MLSKELDFPIYASFLYFLWLAIRICIIRGGMKDQIQLSISGILVFNFENTIISEISVIDFKNIGYRFQKYRVQIFEKPVIDFRNLVLARLIEGEIEDFKNRGGVLEMYLSMDSSTVKKILYCCTSVPLNIYIKISGGYGDIWFCALYP